MSWHQDLIWAFAATVVLTIMMNGSRGLGMTRMDLAFITGTWITYNRDRARSWGLLVHFINGYIFALLYVAAFRGMNFFNWKGGMVIGLIHSLFLLVVVMAILPSIHPRMASEQRGPDPTRLLEPPGFMAMHYGRYTPWITVISHMVYGSILGGFCR